MSRNGGCGIANLENERVEEGIGSEFGRSTANSRAKRVPRIAEQKRWHEREEMAQQYVHCVKDPPCQTCCRYNERLFKTILESKRPFPPYKHKITDFTHSRPRFLFGRRDEGCCRKSDAKSCSLLYHGLQASDVTSWTRSVPPPHPNHPDVVNAPSPWFGREPCDVTKPSEAASRCPRPPSRDYFYGIEASDVTATTRRVPPAAAAPKDEAERGREFIGRARTDVTNFNAFMEGIGHYEKPPIGKPAIAPDACRGFGPPGRLLRPRLNLPALPASSHPPPLDKGSAKGNWKEDDEKAFLSRQPPSSEASCTDRNRAATAAAAAADEPKLRTDSSAAGTPCSMPMPKTSSNTNTSLYSLSRLSEAASSSSSCCADSPRILKRPVLSPCDERSLLMARDASGKLLEPPPVRNAFSAKPPRPPTRALPAAAAAAAAAPDASRPGEVICRHPPSKPCSLSCFEPSPSPSCSRSYGGTSGASKLPDIFARRSKFSPRFSKRESSRCGTPLWKAGPSKSSPFFLPSAHCQTSKPRVHEDTHDKARWKSAMERDGFPCGPRKRMLGRADWKQMVSRDILAGR
ncbi:hypothetical protein MPTK1_5g16160 [Marchantia polymorpha subsp. ruderalis]|nr:hypothetical protein MARPO_0185s0003 [Marchantia polymorpha]BBN11945.1 hypothetical protein Mp_5g16160 [Marchantia polymorpha subsp. ruderalis]|eukprot:PTQ27725.1 hypothetical protein MARPO_0185s0003 [Marchantia polymorpha]